MFFFLFAALLLILLLLREERGVLLWPLNLSATVVTVDGVKKKLALTVLAEESFLFQFGLGQCRHLLHFIQLRNGGPHTLWILHTGPPKKPSSDGTVWQGHVKTASEGPREGGLRVTA